MSTGRPFASNRDNPCGKVRHLTRRDAKTAALADRKRGHHTRPYACAACGFWHTGHLGPGVLTGRVAASALYAPKGGKR